MDWLAEELRRDGARALPFVVLQLDTPFDKCIERIYSRNSGEPSNEDAQCTNFRGLRGAQLAAWRATGAATVQYLDHTRAVEDVLQWFRTGGCSPGWLAA